MPSGPDEFITWIRASASNAIEVQLNQWVRTVDAADPRDGLSRRAWTVGGTNAPRVMTVRVGRSTPDPQAQASRLCMTFDRDFAPGSVYTLAPSPSLFVPSGAAVVTTPVPFVGLRGLPIVGFEADAPAADLAMPPRANTAGVPNVIDRTEALRERLRLRARVRASAFNHLPNFGRGLEPKRTYGPQALQREGATIKADLLQDTDVKSCSITMRRTSPGLLEISFFVVPTFDDRPIEFKETYQIAGVFS